MSAIEPAVRHSVPMFLEAIANVQLGKTEPGAVVEERRTMAISVLAFVTYGDHENLDLGDIAISELAAATMQLCEKPEDQDAVDAFISARRRFNEIQGSLGSAGRSDI